MYLQNNQEIFDYLSNKWESMKSLAIVQKLITERTKVINIHITIKKGQKLLPWPTVYLNTYNL
jgi:hypothetical protein